MLSSERVVQLVRRGNPVPEEADLPEPRLTAIELLNASRIGEPAMTDTRTRKATPDNATQHGRYMRPIAAAAAAALALVVVVGSTALLFGGGGSGRAISSTTEAQSSPTEAPSPTAVAPSTTEAAATTSTVMTSAIAEVAVTLPWVFAEVPAPMAWHWDVAVGSAGIVTASGDQEPVDIDFDGDGEPDEIQFPAVWYSPDLSDWTLVRLPVESDTGCDRSGWRQWQGLSESTAVEAGPLGYIVIGHEECNAAAWISDDGVTWDRIVHPEWKRNPQALRSVTAGGPGWVAVGSDLKGNGVVWASSDGREWQQIEDNDLLWADRPVDMWDVKAGGPGLVAVGIEGTETSSGVSAVWVSSDGFAWERLPDDAVGGAGLFYLSVDPATGRMVTFSRPPTDTPLEIRRRAQPDITPGQAWTSADGRAWVGSSTPSAPVTGRAIWDGDVILAVSRGQDGGDPGLWLSEDQGLTWHLIDGPEGVLNASGDYAPFAIERFGDRILIVGQCDTCSGVWVSQPTG